MAYFFFPDHGDPQVRKLLNRLPLAPRLPGGPAFPINRTIGKKPGKHKMEARLGTSKRALAMAKADKGHKPKYHKTPKLKQANPPMVEPDVLLEMTRPIRSLIRSVN